MNFDDFRDFVTTREDLAWAAHQRVRQLVEESYQELFDSLQICNRDEAITKAVHVAQKALRVLSTVIDLDKVDAAHGIGHLNRDYIHGLLLSKENIDCRHLYIGIIAGILHDVLGCSIVDRYDDKNRAVKHAEVGALLWSSIAAEIQLDSVESVLVYYGIAAHTRALREASVICSDKTERIITPYVDTDENGPRLMFWLPRWIDRLDANGPCFIGRHFLTLARDHSDLDSSGGYYKIRFNAHMRPLLRNEEEIMADPEGRTLREHLMMYANSQTDTSPYGKYDGEIMCRLRDNYKESLLRIIDSFEDSFSYSSRIGEAIKEGWNKWLSENIEPSSSGKAAVTTLSERFDALPKETKKPWFNAMATALEQHKIWRQKTRRLLSSLPEEVLTAPLIGNVRLGL
jgi:hypothetical protein